MFVLIEFSKYYISFWKTLLAMSLIGCYWLKTVLLRGLAIWPAPVMTDHGKRNEARGHTGLSHERTSSQNSKGNTHTHKQSLKTSRTTPWECGEVWRYGPPCRTTESAMFAAGESSTDVFDCDSIDAFQVLSEMCTFIRSSRLLPERIHICAAGQCDLAHPEVHQNFNSHVQTHPFAEEMHGSWPRQRIFCFRFDWLAEGQPPPRFFKAHIGWPLLAWQFSQFAGTRSFTTSQLCCCMPSANMAAEVGRSDRCLCFECLWPRKAPKCIHGSGGMARHGVIETNCRVSSRGIVLSGGTRTWCVIAARPSTWTTSAAASRLLCRCSSGMAQMFEQFAICKCLVDGQIACGCIWVWGHRIWFAAMFSWHSDFPAGRISEIVGHGGKAASQVFESHQ